MASPWDPVYLMGVSGCGKSVIGTALADKLGGTFIDGDDLHPPANKEKMSAGVALDDEDRYPWFELIRQNVLASEKRPVVVACSALKRSYRDILRAGQDRTSFVYLEGSFDLIMGRIQQRDHEYMPPDLLRSQFDTLEIPSESERVITINIQPEVSEIVTQLIERLSDHKTKL
ncbi:MAG: gluconokinase [Verrucomicrobia bacterium]|nr:gluconokinase [Verrucomicrobiota bacterium]